MRQDKLYPDVTWNSYELLVKILSGTNTRIITWIAIHFNLKWNFYLEKKPGILIQKAGGPVFISCLNQQKVSYNGLSRARFKYLHWFMKLHLNLEDEAIFRMEEFAPNSQSFNLCFEYYSDATGAEKEKHWDTIHANTSPDQIWYNGASNFTYTHIYLCHVDAAVTLSPSILQLQLQSSYSVLIYIPFESLPISCKFCCRRAFVCNKASN